MTQSANTAGIIISIFVHCNPLKLQTLKFYFCAFCAFLRPYQKLIFEISLDQTIEFMNTAKELPMNVSD